MSKLSNMKKSELYELAKDLGIPGRSRMTKRELADAIAQAPRGRAPRSIAKQSPPPARAPTARASSPMPAPRTPPADEERRRPDTFVDVGPPLPEDYGRDVLVAMVRDPKCIHCYWELAGGARRTLAQRCGRDVVARGQWILRTHNVAAGDYRDTDITVDSRRWYLHVADDCELRVEIGLRVSEDRFLAVARSNTVVTPPLSISESADEQWMIVEEAFRKLMEISHAGSISSSPGEFPARFRGPAWGRSGVPVSSPAPRRKE